MDLVCAEPAAETIRVSRYHKNGPLTGEQQALIEKWYVYAMAVAYDHAHWPYDDDEVRTVAHDALIGAARYFREGRGCKTFKSFYKHCLLPQLARAFRKRIARSARQMPLGMDVPTHPGPAPFETQEFVDHLKRGLPEHQSQVLHQVYDMGMSHRQIAALRGCQRQNVSNIHKLALRQMRRRAQ